MTNTFLSTVSGPT